jgi:uncharacterized protein (DUF1330 family)
MPPLSRRHTVMGLAGTVTAAAASGLAAGPAAGQASGQAAPVGNPGLLLVYGRSTDAGRMRQYAMALPPVYAAHEGYYLGIGGQGRGVNWIEGGAAWQGRSLVLAHFPSLARVQEFWWSEPYRAAVRLRERAGVFSVQGLEAGGPVAFQGAGSAYLVMLLASTDARRADAAGAALSAAVSASGGAMLTGTSATAPVALEGDLPFDRVWIAGWPDAAARERYLASRAGRAAARLRAAAGFTVAATLDGVARAQRPPAASATPAATPPAPASGT